MVILLGCATPAIATAAWGDAVERTGLSDGEEDEEYSLWSDIWPAMAMIGGAFVVIFLGVWITGGKTGPGNVLNRGNASIYVQTRGGGGGGRGGGGDSDAGE